MASRERDLEIGGTTSEEDGAKDRVNVNIQAFKSVSGALSGFLDFDVSLKRERTISSASNAAKFGEIAIENVELLIEKSSGDEESQEHVALLEMKKEKHKKSNPYKPPRPPKGPALDVADMKLIRDLSELAMRKRMSLERVKALKKKKRAAKATSSSSSLLAMIVTLLFCLIIIFQGICSPGSLSSNFQGPHEPAAIANGEGLISVQYLKNLSHDSCRGQ